MGSLGRKNSDGDPSIVLIHRYEHRITIVKHGKELMTAGDYTNALMKFNEYFKIISEVKKVNDLFELSPKDFNPKKDITEMLMISHLYYEMARIYDTSAKFSEEAKKCIQQFVAFTVDQPYMLLNSELARKSLRRRAFKNSKIFRDAYEQIVGKSQNCFIVTYCYGNDHQVTYEFRQFKKFLLGLTLGHEAVRIYYLFSSRIIEKWGKHPALKLLGRFVFRPALGVLAKILFPLILKKNR